MSTAEPARVRLALAAVGFGLGAPLAYVGQRVYERARGAIVSPFRIVRDLHTGYFYRVAIATFIGVVVAVSVHAALEVRRTDARDVGGRALAIVTLVVSAVVVSLSVGAP